MAQFIIKEQEIVYKTWVWTIEADNIKEVQEMINNSQFPDHDDNYIIEDNENGADNIWKINDEEFIPIF